MARASRLIGALVVLLTSGSSATDALASDGWVELCPGLQHSNFLGGDAQAFRIDLQKFRLTLAEADPQNGRRGLSARALAKGTQALLAVNGGYFQPSFAPLGLRVSEGKRLGRLRKADWGVLTITPNGRARLVHTRDYRHRPGAIDFALQAGPRLVDAGRTLSMKPQRARRTAIGITRDARSLVLVVVDRGMFTSELARHMLDTFGCSYAINLDGGSSTQLWSSLQRVRQVAGAPVANAVLVVPR